MMGPRGVVAAGQCPHCWLTRAHAIGFPRARQRADGGTYLWNTNQNDEVDVANRCVQSTGSVEVSGCGEVEVCWTAAVDGWWAGGQ
jgi:hypothetical protein